MMIDILAQKAGDSTWRKVGEKAVVTAVTTLITEAIKASVELMKKAKLREQKAQFDDRRAQQKGNEQDKADEQEKGDESGEDAVDAADDEDEQPDENDAADSEGGSEDDSKDADPSEKTGPSVDFASYVAKQH